MFKWFEQIFSVTRMSLQSLPARRGASASTIVGIAGVVAVLVTVLSIAEGVRRMVENSASPDNAIVLRSGADSEMMSGLSGDETLAIGDAPGLARDADGALASPELFVILALPKRTTGTDANVPLRGVKRAAPLVRDGFEIVEGRMFEWGLNEVIVGSGAALQFAGLDLGASLEVGEERWPIVGIFESRGGIAESEVWADAAVVQSSYRRGNSFQSVYTRLESAGSFLEFKDSLTTDPRLNVKVVRAGEFYGEQSTMLRGIITVVGTLIAGLMGLGAIFGALNTMYSAVSARTLEIATLRALGFRGGPVIVSVLIEALLLAVIGGLIGGGLAFLAFDGFQTATINYQSFSQIAFAFNVTSDLLIRGITYAALIGLVGGLFPAFRAARMPVATALREG